MTEEQEKYELIRGDINGGALVKAPASLFFDIQKFEHAQRVAKMLATSTIIPEHFRNNMGNCVIALNYAERIKADPFMVMQNLYVVHGRPGIEGKLVIALVNQSQRFEPLQFEYTEGKSCHAFAKEIKSGKILKGTEITWNMVEKEGWASKNGSKWQTMPEQMFKYRAAAFFARTYCPEVLLGMQTIEEIYDVVEMKSDPRGVYTASISEDIKTERDLKSEINEKLNGLKEKSQITPKTEEPQQQTAQTWNPLNEQPQERYSSKKQQILLAHCLEKDIETDGKKYRDLHQELIDRETNKNEPFEDYRQGPEWESFKEACANYGEDIFKRALENAGMEAVVTTADAVIMTQKMKALKEIELAKEKI